MKNTERLAEIIAIKKQIMQLEKEGIDLSVDPKKGMKITQVNKPKIYEPFNGRSVHKRTLPNNKYKSIGRVESAIYGHGKPVRQ